MVGTAEAGTLVGALVAVGLSAAGYFRWSIHSELDDKADAHVEERVERLSGAHEETRRLAEAAYATVHGDEDRPADAGFVVESKERWERLEAEMERVSESVDHLEATQERHQHKTEVILDAIAEELDVEIMFRGDGGEQ